MTIPTYKKEFNVAKWSDVKKGLKERFSGCDNTGFDFEFITEKLEGEEVYIDIFLSLFRPIFQNITVLVAKISSENNIDFINFDE